MIKKEIQATTVKKGNKLTAIASTEDRDRHGDVLKVSDWDFAKFLQNPVLQAGHKYDPQFTIGKAENLRVEGNQVLFDPVFHEITPLAKQVKQMYEEGFLKAWSVGFIPGSVQEGKGLEDGGTPNELLEVSAVAVPANAYALMKGFEMDDSSLEERIKEFVGSDDTDIPVEEDVETAEVDEVDTKAVKEGSTGETNSHVHTATYDETSGNGTTDNVNGHVHSIKNFEVQETDGHTHSLTTSAKKDFIEAKEYDSLERWNKSLPAVFDRKGFDINSVQSEHVFFSHDIMSKYLGCEVKDIFSNFYEIPSPLIGQYLAGFKSVMSEYELEDTRNWTGQGVEVPPQYEVIQLSSSESDDFLVDGCAYYKVHSDDNAVIKFFPTFWSMGVEIVTPNSKKDWNKNILEKVHKWVKDNNKLKGEKFSLSGQFIPKTEKTWDDVVLDKGFDTIVQRNLDKVVDNEAKSRGLLFIGPPGTGKTMTGKIMKDMSESTFVWVSSSDMYKIGSIGALKLAFQLARDLAPTILFIEDIDTWLKENAMDLLKTELDGVRENKGLLTVLTSNEPENLPDALLDRPGRFHEILEFNPPSEEGRKEMLKRWVGDIGEETLKSVVERTDGFSGAYMKEIIDYAKMIAEDEELSLDEALIKSLEKTEEQKKLIQRIRQTQEKSAIIEVKEGRVISKKNRKILGDAKDALEKVLHIEDKEEEEQLDAVKGISDFIPTEKVAKEVARSEQLTEDEIMRRTLQKVAGMVNEGLHKSKK